MWCCLKPLIPLICTGMSERGIKIRYVCVIVCDAGCMSVTAWKCVTVDLWGVFENVKLCVWGLNAVCVFHVCAAPLLMAAVWFGGDTLSFLSSKKTRHYYKPAGNPFLLSSFLFESIPWNLVTSLAETSSSSFTLNPYWFCAWTWAPGWFCVLCNSSKAQVEFIFMHQTVQSSCWSSSCASSQNWPKYKGCKQSPMAPSSGVGAPLNPECGDVEYKHIAGL